MVKVLVIDNIPVVMVSAGPYQAPDDAAAFIRKLFNLTDLLNTLDCVLST